MPMKLMYRQCECDISTFSSCMIFIRVLLQPQKKKCFNAHIWSSEINAGKYHADIQVGVNSSGSSHNVTLCY